MKKVKFIIYLILFTIFFFKHSFSNDKIAILDLDSLLESTIYGKKIINELNIINEKNLNSLKEIENKIKLDQENIQKQKNILSEEELNNKINDLNKEIKTFQIEKNKLINNFNLEKKKKLDIFFAKIIPEIEKYVDANNINLVIDKKNIFIANKKNNITEDIAKIIEQEGNEIALIMLGGVNYYTGQAFEFEKITELAHLKGINVGFDLAHAAGNIKLELNKWGVDFAVWCSYKYLNSGPGSVAAAFVHEKHHNDNLPRFAGWWGHNKEDRFKMPDNFFPITTAEGWQLSNPPILSLAAIRASLSIFDEVGMEKLFSKSKKLSEYLLFLLDAIESDRIEIITPKERGCQLSIRVKNGNKELFDKITQKGVIADWREPDVIRIAPVPLYNSFTDIFNFYLILQEVL